MGEPPGKLPPPTSPMHIVAIAWIYVALMAAITQPTLTAGLITFVFWGVFPLTIVLYILGSPDRRKRRKAAEAAAERAESGSE